MADFEVAGLDAVNDGRVLLRFWQKLRGSEAFARRGALDIADVLANDLVIGQGKPW